MQVEKIMTRDVASCTASDSLNRAAQLMWEHDCGCIPVVDGDKKLVGIVTDRDLTMAAYTQGKALAQIAVGDVMAHELHTCSAPETVAEVESRMREAQVRRLPVIDASGMLVGIVSLNDLALEAARERGRHAERSQTEVARTLAEVSRHRPAQAGEMAAA